MRQFAALAELREADPANGQPLPWVVPEHGRHWSGLHRDRRLAEQATAFDALGPKLTELTCGAAASERADD